MSDVLVVAASGLGPFVQALGMLAAIRAHHGGDRITLLTRPETAAFAEASRYADAVIAPSRRAWWDVGPLWRLRQRLRAVPFAAIYDCDSEPHGWLRLLLSQQSRSRLVDDPPDWRNLHVHDRLTARLRRAGIDHMPQADLSWIARRVTGFTLPFSMSEPFLLIDLDASTSSGAGWPAERLAPLIDAVIDAGLQPVLVGATPHEHLRAAAAATSPDVVDLTGSRALGDMVFLAWAARGAVGCDTGLMHLFAAAGCRAVVIYDAASDPARHGHRGARITILRRPTFVEIPVAEIVAALKPALGSA